ncbi:cytidine deaminase-like protein [Amniculicola lignicola CBS 123094]|uniref:Cytidine deaminase-like protein n=1 Tax=Amniculicola lignicola CBS 123094 TaxID=1392246 RepID=A0A6A5W1W9_9PLEO|nr:cytidine deaminase-like protein [Amniculicola lignicola CBS 123094]
MSTNRAADEAAQQLGIVPCSGRLVPLRTKDEVRAALETFDAYVIEVTARYAGVIKDVIQQAIPSLRTADWQHLRRVVQYKYLPEHLQKKFCPQPEDADDGDIDDEDSEAFIGRLRYFLISPTTAISYVDLVDVLTLNSPFAGRAKPPKIVTVAVPALAPTSAEQAAQWSLQYWPIAYKNTNPYGPHPSLVARNGAEIEDEAGTWLALAEAAAQQTREKGLGEAVGCVIVDRRSGSSEVISVAGDCRWRSLHPDCKPGEGPGNVMAHAVQRTIAMAAKKRLRVAGTSPAYLDRELFNDSPLTDLEQRYYDIDNMPPNGYLCVDLDIYLTHEPCVMCSMAILHSRFRRCVFAKRMPLTGGLTADDAAKRIERGTKEGNGLGHGIFWRPSELNWKFLAWEWEDSAQKGKAKDGMDSRIIDTLQA